MASWFEKLTGFPETSTEYVHQQLRLEGERIYSKANNRSFHWGQLAIPTLADLRQQTSSIKGTGRLQLREVIGDVALYHADLANENAVFQAASQFNLLEMVSPNVNPEDGISRYEDDHTQGPACAIACGAGTIYRNYFVPLGGQTGQSADLQIDCLSELARFFDNERYNYWTVQNGYAFAKKEKLRALSEKINSLSPQAYFDLLGLLRVGIQWDTEVTTSPKRHRVSQVYCSALPVLYSSISADHWESFARLVLKATYEASFRVAVINQLRTGCNKLFLTLVGGGAFGNKPSWIKDAILDNLQLFSRYDLDVRFISYGGPSTIVGKIITDFNRD